MSAVKVSNGKVMLENHLPHHSEWKFEGDTVLSEEDNIWLEAPLEDESDNVRDILPVLKYRAS